MPDRLPHLIIARAEPRNVRRRGRGFSPEPPAQPRRHARELGQNLGEHENVPEDELAGFDPRHLLKLEIDGIASDELANIPEFSVVAEEGKNVTVLFATDAALREFRRRLIQLEAGQSATREQILYAVKRFDYITPDDRRGSRLSNEGVPSDDEFLVDVELWPLDLRNERDEMLKHFTEQCGQLGIAMHDCVNHPALVLYRVSASNERLDHLLHMRDVRRVDLPPQYEFEMDLLGSSIDDLPQVEAPMDGAPTVAVLDTGIAAAHPLLADAVGDAQSFMDNDDPTDATGHGTAVAGFALLGDVAEVVRRDTYVPELCLLSGKIHEGRVDETLIENRVEEAVRYFTKHYNCRVFNLSLGHHARPYTGGQVDRLAATLDWLSREYQVLFVVSTGNIRGNAPGPANWREAYPRYLLEDEFRMLDPAPALNALTVGALANYELSRMAVRHPEDPAFQPIAHHDQPAPFTLSGPGPNGAIKPDLVDYGGNRYIDSRLAPRPAIGNELGELALGKEFATGNLYRVNNGTSFAAPRVAHTAAVVAGQNPDASPSLIRALLAAHASIPKPCTDLGLEKDELHCLVGYGQIHKEKSMYSENNRVTIMAEEQLAPNEHHFFEIPMPADLLKTPARRLRRFTVAIAHTPRVRRTRIKYRESELSFRMVRAENLEAVTQSYRRLKKGETEDCIPESGFFPGPNMRDGGTLQCATRTMAQINQGFDAKPYFLVVTNSVPSWVSSDDPEPYAVVVVIEDLSDVEVQLYAQVKLELQNRVRARARMS